MPQIRTPDGAVINYSDAGSGQPIIFLHGWLMSNLVWAYQQRLTENFRIIVPDLRGHGGSGGAVFSYDSCVADLGTLLDALGMDKAIVVGWSMGAQIALHSWPQLQSRLAGLVLVGATPLFCRQEGYGHGVPLADARGMAVRLKRNFNLTAGEFYQGMFTPDERMEHAVNSLSKSIVGRLPAPALALSALNELIRADLRDVLPDISIPVLLSHGGADRICLPEAAIYMHDKLPHSRLEIFPGTGHAPFLTRPSEFNALLTDFARATYDRN